MDLAGQPATAALAAIVAEYNAFLVRIKDMCDIKFQVQAVDQSLWNGCLFDGFDLLPDRPGRSAGSGCEI